MQIKNVYHYITLSMTWWHIIYVTFASSVLLHKTSQNDGVISNINERQGLYNIRDSFLGLTSPRLKLNFL